MFFYTVYGLTVRSNISLAGVALAAAESFIDLDWVFHLNSHDDVKPNSKVVWYQRRSAGAVNLTINCDSGRSAFHWKYDDGTQFLISASGGRVEIAWKSS